MKIFAVFGLLALVGLTAGQYNYQQALSKAILFFEAQRTGVLPANNRIDWRDDSFLLDGNDNRLDLTGGYFDAGDHVKFGFPLGHTLIFLAWGLIDFKAGYQTAGEYENARDALKWGTDWILKASADIDQNKVCGQVGDGYADHAYWGRPEEQDQNRPSYFVTSTAPGTDLTANYASALALASVVFADNAAYSSQLLAMARKLYTFADTYKGKYSDSISNAAGFYFSYSYADELAFAAAAMALVTNEQTYKTAATNLYNAGGYDTYNQEFFDWDNKNAGINILMAKIFGDAKYRTAAQKNCDYWRLNSRRTPKGLVYINDWGSLRHAANAAFGCLLVAQNGIGDVPAARAFAKQQVDYMLGSAGRSYVVGFGVNPPERPHHRAASCEDLPAACSFNDLNKPGPNGQVHNGALVGGPDGNDNYVDDRNNFQNNEVAIDYQAGFIPALAGIIANSGK